MEPFRSKCCVTWFMRIVLFMNAAMCLVEIKHQSLDSHHEAESVLRGQLPAFCKPWISLQLDTHHPQPQDPFLYYHPICALVYRVKFQLLRFLQTICQIENLCVTPHSIMVIYSEDSLDLGQLPHPPPLKIFRYLMIVTNNQGDTC
jgi:hypothetical protein